MSTKPATNVNINATIPNEALGEERAVAIALLDAAKLSAKRNPAFVPAYLRDAGKFSLSPARKSIGGPRLVIGVRATIYC